MPTLSPRALGVMLSGAALAGWLSGSALDPPVATTQVGTPRARPAPAAHAALPRVAWPSALRRVAPPAPSRNPFTFRASPRAAGGEATPRTVTAAVTAAVPLSVASDADAAAVLIAPTTMWRLSGIATSENGDVVAVLSGGGEVVLVRAGDELPGGDGVVDVGPAHVVVDTAAGAVTLRLP